jgi:hypothetical protein
MLGQWEHMQLVWMGEDISSDLGPAPVIDPDSKSNFLIKNHMIREELKVDDALLIDLLTKEDLIAACDQASVMTPTTRHSALARQKVMLCAGHLRQGCRFQVTSVDLYQYEVQIWPLYVEETLRKYKFVLPSLKELEAAKGGDWYEKIYQDDV